MSHGLDSVRKAARERKQERFTSLLHHLKIALPRDSFSLSSVKLRQGCESGREDWPADLHVRVHRGTYRAKPLRRVFILKADGRQGPLGIAWSLLSKDDKTTAANA
jgi:hypothetical protein